MMGWNFRYRGGMKALNPQTPLLLNACRHDNRFSIYDTPFIMNECWVRLINKIVILIVKIVSASPRAKTANLGPVTGPIRNYLINNIIFLIAFMNNKGAIQNQSCIIMWSLFSTFCAYHVCFFLFNLPPGALAKITQLFYSFSAAFKASQKPAVLAPAY